MKTSQKLTKKIQLLIDLPTPEERKEAMDRLHLWQNRAYRAANLIVSHLYVQEMLQEFLYLSEGLRYKIADEKMEELGMLNRSRTNTTYRLVSDRFKGEMPTNILSNLNQRLLATFKKQRPEYWNGERSLPNFRRDMPFPFCKEGIGGLHYSADKKAFCFRLFKLPLRTYLGRGAEDKHQLLQKVIDGEAKLCTSQIQLREGKIFWLAVFEAQQEKQDLMPHIVAQASLSLEHPITVRTASAKLTIGNREEFLHRRLAIQAASRRVQKGAAYAHSGKGTKRKLKGTDKFKGAEHRYVNHKLHLYSKRLIDFCIEQRAGTLILQDQQLKTDIAKEDEFLLRNWSYQNLLEKIAYKAQKAGIELIPG